MSTILRATANTFKPGSQFHFIKRRVKWHIQGITKIKSFFIEDDESGYETAFPHGRHFIRIPKSNIRNFNEKESVPFQINSQNEKKQTGLVRQGPIRYNYCDN